MKQIVIEQLKRHEGYRGRPYQDTVGKLTVGYGRNLDDVGITKGEAQFMLMNDIAIAEHDARQLFPNFDLLTENRQAVLVNMAFNLGVDRLSYFRRLIKAVIESRFDDAAHEMLDSKWARQVKGRALELAQLMKDG